MASCVIKRRQLEVKGLLGKNMVPPMHLAKGVQVESEQGSDLAARVQEMRDMGNCTVHV